MQGGALTRAWPRPRLGIAPFIKKVDRCASFPPGSSSPRPSLSVLPSPLPRVPPRTPTARTAPASRKASSIPSAASITSSPWSRSGCGRRSAAALSIRLPIAAAAALVGLFALFHGHAHGSELPETASALAYGLGFVAATAALHGFGIALGVLLRRDAGRLLVRLGGAGVAATGLALAAVL